MLGKLVMNYAQHKEVVILVVVSFLLVMLIYSSVANFAFARKKISSVNTCYKSTPDKPSATSADICCTMFYSNGKLSSSLCQKCNYDSDGNKIDCRIYSTMAGPGSVAPPPSAGLLNARDTGTFNDTTTGNTTNLSNAGNAVQQLQPQQQKLQTTTTCPNGSTPDAKGNCPPNDTVQTLKQPSSDSNNLGNSKGGSETKSNSDNNNNNNDNPTSDHHHKGNDLGKKEGGSETKKGSTGGSDAPQTNQEKTAT
jgi:hypothetical protein